MIYLMSRRVLQPLLFLLMTGSIAAVLYPLYIHPRHGNGPRWTPAMAVQKQKSDQAMGLMRQGCVEVKQGNYAEGQAFFNKALAVDKTDPTLWLLLADVCERQGRWAEALRTYQGLLKGSGRYSSLCSDPVTHLRYALALLRNGQWQEATTEYANVRYQINQTDPTALPNRDFDPGKDNRPRLEAAVHLVLGTRRPTYGWFYGPLATED